MDLKKAKYAGIEQQRLKSQEGTAEEQFANLEDIQKHNCTVEEMEEYEPHVVRGNVIYAGVDYEAIVRAAEEDPDGCDVILWDGGNNDFPFYQSDLHVTVCRKSVGPI